jgi:hypothetical protein
MATTTQTPAERQAAAKSLQAQTAVREFRRVVDKAVEDFAASVARLSVDSMIASQAVGGDSTRPHYTDDLGQLLAQQRRLDVLRAALNQV